jgi:hypothetical protein
MPIQILPDPLTLLRPVSKTVTVTKTRPADTVPYAQGDTLSESTSAGTVWTFPWARAAGLGAILQDAALIASTAQTLRLDAQLWLFDTAPTTTLNDNVAWAPTDAEMKTLLTVVVFAVANVQVGSGNTVIEAAALARSMACATGATSIFGVLRVNNAYIPTSAEDVTVRLRQIQD